MNSLPPTLDSTQTEALQRILDGESIFLTGSAGCGKSFLMREIIRRIPTVVCAPSGIAALNVGGSTCHSIFQLPTNVVTPEDLRQFPRKAYELFGASGKKPPLLLIDEISMLRRDHFEAISKQLSKVRRNNSPFGGVQVVVVGDFFQLPPILTSSENKAYAIQGYDSIFCFTSKHWNFKTIELTQVHRVGDQRQVALLNSIRRCDKWKDRAIQLVQQEAKEYNPSLQQLHLCAYNKDADAINSLWYDKLDSKEYTSYAQTTGNWKQSDNPVAEVLKLKVGAKVIITANSVDNSYKNGSQGIILEVSWGTVLIVLENGEQVGVERNTWEKKGYVMNEQGELQAKTEATFTQFPLKYGWAISIHKSQGMTLDDFVIDVGKGCFTSGQAYVAISRARDLTNISFASTLRSKDVFVDKQVINFYKGFQNE